MKTNTTQQTIINRRADTYARECLSKNIHNMHKYRGNDYRAHRGNNKPGASGTPAGKGIEVHGQGYENLKRACMPPKGTERNTGKCS